MKRTDMNRRDFTRLSAAAFGGVVAGSLVGCGETATDTPAPAGGAADPADGGDAAPAEGGGEGSGTTAAGGGDEATHDVANMMGDAHVCRGLNACMGKGAGGDNACGGQGACATAEHHACHEANACKGQGGCGEHPGQNACKSKGECAVPLGEDAWAKARTAFEEAMTAAGKTAGAAPEAG